MSETQTKDDPQKWIKEPTETFHGLRLVDHDGTVFVEQIDNDGEKRQSVMITEAEEFVEAVEWFAQRHPGLRDDPPE